jgi:cell division transport system permease protein
VFAVIAFVAIGATINIVLISREDEIAIMKMVGATRSFIARPLVIEGFAKGVLGAVLALVLLTVTYSLLEQRVVSLTFYSPLQVVGGILLGGALGALASVFTLRRHLSTW